MPLPRDEHGFLEFDVLPEMQGLYRFERAELKTRHELAQLGKKNETIEEIIRRPMDFYIKKGLPTQQKRDLAVK